MKPESSAAPHVFPFVAASLAASKDRYSKSIGETRLMVGNMIRMMCRSPKSRAGCHFAAAIGLRSLLEWLRADDTGLRARHAHDEGQGDGPWSRSFPRGRREADPAADRRRSLRGRSLSVVGAQVAGQVSQSSAAGSRTFRPPLCPAHARHALGQKRERAPSCEQPPHTIEKASKLEPSSTRLAAISVRNPSETKS